MTHHAQLKAEAVCNHAGALAFVDRSSFRARPITLAEAREFVGRVHSHLPTAPPSWRFGVALEVELYQPFQGPRARWWCVVAVAMAGRPCARHLDDGETVEVTRCASVGLHGAASMLLGRVCRAAQAMGYARAITYTREGEAASSVRAAGFVLDGETTGSGGRRCSGPKSRWVRRLAEPRRGSAIDWRQIF